MAKHIFITIVMIVILILNKENTIESEFDSFMDSIVEYDTLVNQYFLPLIK